MNVVYKISKGVLLAIALMLVAQLLSGVIPMMGTALLALLLGIVVRQLLPHFEPFSAGVVWTEKYILETAIVLLGAGFQFSKLQAVGHNTFLVIIASVVLILVLAWGMQKLTGHKSKLFWLLGAGSAICGSSAIGATAPLLKAKEEETGISLAVINLLGLLGMVLLPLIAGLLHFNATETGIFLGAILQSVGHVVGASFSISNEVGEIATLVKLSRVSLLFPFLLMVYFLVNKQHESNTRLKFPKFILLFALVLILVVFNVLPQPIIKAFTKSSDVLFNIAMAAIGLKINLPALLKISGKGFVYGGVIFLFQLVFFVTFILLR
jgi:uncharacterized integral membrane protein (TIGR00698 family)